jgi:hypothetical protein
VHFKPGYLESLVLYTKPTVPQIVERRFAACFAYVGKDRKS